MKEDCGVRARVAGELRRGILNKGEETNKEETLVEIKEEPLEEVLGIPVDEDSREGDGFTLPEDKDKEDAGTDHDDKKEDLSSGINDEDKTEYQCFRNLLPLYKQLQAITEMKPGDRVKKKKRKRTSAKPKVKVPFPCPHPGCGKICRMRHKLKEHSICHSDARPYLCPSCGRAYKTKGDLKKHEITHLDVDVLPYPCTHCPLRFPVPSAWKHHVESVQEVKEPKLCTECGAQFVHETSLRVHMKVHETKL